MITFALVIATTTTSADHGDDAETPGPEEATGERLPWPFRWVHAPKTGSFFGAAIADLICDELQGAAPSGTTTTTTSESSSSSTRETTATTDHHFEQFRGTKLPRGRGGARVSRCSVS
eukprot:CAMPEP_0185713494 /NCGR_PEP_ID=MMETSP1164-20130828/36949_1 /TAXON_ID=1104430 /ORGANISM="Chrysoreinhardia sp, Strain CCMP2950" /LENGTH=117 /DNA_ID=CAMNT_0028381065 /DNA_START=56 /DNA_END=406 /DNA_ORIENTATION=-